MRTLRNLMGATAVSLIALPAVAQETVVWWDFLAGGDGVRMKALIDGFNAEHEGEIVIDATTLEWGVPYYTKVRTSAAVGEGPDVMTYHLSRLPLALEEGILTPITDEDLEMAGLSRDDFFEASVEAASGDDGTLYALPFDIHSIVLYYNKSFLEGTDYLDADGNLTGIESLEDFNAALAAARENGSETPLSYQTGGDGGVWRVFYTLLSQQGGEFIVDGEVLPGDNADKAVRALQIMTDWSNEGITPAQAEYEASVALFTSGTSAFHMNGVWEVPTMTDMAADGTLGFEWGAVQVPVLLDEAATWADSHAFAIPVQGDEEMTPEKRAAVMEVIGWMERNSIGWASAGHIPAYVATVESEEYASMEPNSTYASLADTASFDPRNPIAGVASPVYDAALNIMVPTLAGFLTPEDAVAQMQADLSGMMQ
ncbi:extracellular solute-binding protein [Wenxinia saemankumensis]|uniref:Carbohydrate ABC transporter substrate-binding protein, CUT1 family n=1 Tax=Wenxinia saemankumensis TaxID=1447782 RepID=A0A1M6DWY8_9RHOB|nr:extracellular solute-binding protein [Wenxinia saemankumensis]SHI77712.1 carbohydrate ABC transporter substrate-binding protein, CUT1 family [Wenxinia saemankumensis]